LRFYKIIYSDKFCIINEVTFQISGFLIFLHYL